MSRTINRLEATMVVANDKVRISTQFYEPAKLGAVIMFEESAYIDSDVPLGRGMQTKIAIDITPDQFERIADELTSFADNLRKRAAATKAHAELDDRLNGGASHA